MAKLNSKKTEKYALTKKKMVGLAPGDIFTNILRQAILYESITQSF